MKKKIIVTGGTGRFGKVLKKTKSNHNLIYPSKKKLNITDFNKTRSYLKKNKPSMVIHLAGLSRPMNIHEKNLSKSIDLNIIGTANISKVCKKYNIKLIYFSTGYVYEGTKGNYSEKDPVKPFNNYGLSKLGGECAVAMYKNSLILRITMTEKPFLHHKAYANLKSNFMFHESLVEFLPKLINQKGIVNVGGKSQSVYNFAKKYNPKVKKIFLNKKSTLPRNQHMNLEKLKKIISKNNKNA